MVFIMRFILDYNANNIFILGAGASVDYGLPTWLELKDLIIKKISSSDGYQYKKEILEWLSYVGNDKKYRTVDECIKHESITYHENGHKIEDELFRVIKDVFDDLYKENQKGWIRLFNDKIKSSSNLMHQSIAFINYNYDNVLDLNLLNFSHLSAKEREINDSDALRILANVEIPVLRPHGQFDTEKFLHTNSRVDTNKTGKDDYIDVVSCYESKKHEVVFRDSRNIISNNKFNLYILGLGGGLSVNLNNIDFKGLISEINITIKDGKNNDAVSDFLVERFKIDKENIKIFSDCEELIDKCF